MQLRKVVAPVLAAVLLAAVGAGIWYSNREVAQQASAQLELSKQATLRGVIGSEKEAFFADPRVQQALAKHGLTVNVEKAGSRVIATRYEPKQYDFGFPSGAPAGNQLKALAKSSNVHTPFYTPIVVASWKPIAEILVSNGVAQRHANGYYELDLKALLAMSDKGLRWRDLKGSSAFATGKAVLLASTDVRSSNSAAMYLALASYLANGEQVVQSAEDVNRVLPMVAPLFLRQGFQEASSAGPFEDYLALGMGKAPLLVAYESQMIEFWLKHPDKAKGDMVLMYPRPTVYSKHVLVPFSANGARLGHALESDAALRELAHQHGYRTGGERKGPELWRDKGLQAPEVLVDVIEPPSHEWLDRMIQSIEQRFK
jgi:hypothetical protein